MRSLDSGFGIVSIAVDPSSRQVHYKHTYVIENNDTDTRMQPSDSEFRMAPTAVISSIFWSCRFFEFSSTASYACDSSTVS